MAEEDWRYRGQSFLDCNRHMYDTKYATDVVFAVGEMRTEIPAHKYVLICRSPVFDAMLRWEKNVKNPIKIVDSDPDAFAEMLRFVYYEEVNIMADNITNILYLSQKYILPGLTEKCNEYLEKHLNVHTVCSILEQAIIYSHEDLTNKCMDIVQGRTKRVFSSEEFVNITPLALEKILKSNFLACKNETVVYKSCLRWAEARCIESNVEPSEENRRKVLGDMVYLIRFPCMRFEEFANIMGTTSFLTESEKCLIYYTIGSGGKIPNVNQNKIKQFISTARYFMAHSSKEIAQHKEIIIQRFTEIDESWNYDSKASDAITFEVSKDIIMHGIGLYGSDSPSSHKIEVSLFDEKENRLIHIHLSEMSSDGRQESLKIRFPTPWVILACKRYTIAVQMDGPATYCGDRGEDAVTWGDMSVKFSSSAKSTNATNVEQGQIPELIIQPLEVEHTKQYNRTSVRDS